MDDILVINPKVVGGGDKIFVGQTLLLPANKLSQRDLSIIAGMHPGQKVREYPLRRGEKVEDVARARGISMEELRELNPSLRGTKVLLLPADRYTVREQEMMTGVLGMPQNFFKQGGVANMVLFSAAGFTAFLLALALRAAERRD